MVMLRLLWLAAACQAFVSVVRRGASPLRSLRRFSMEEDGDDYPSDSTLPDEPAAAFEPEVADVDAPSDVEDAGGSAPPAGAGPAEGDWPSDVQDAAAAPAAVVDPEAAYDAERALLDRCLGLERGATASAADRNEVAALVGDLEALAPPFEPYELEGTWSLVYSSEPGIYRSSPFFWGFSRLLDGKNSPTPVPGAKSDGLADGIYAVTDALGLFYTVGEATQTITGSSLVSEVDLAIEPLPNLPPVGRSVMTSTATCAPTATGLRLTLEKTEVKDSTIASLPGLGFLSDVAFPTQNAFDAVSDALKLTPNAHTVSLISTYVSDALRVTRTEDGFLFVHERTY